MKNIKNKLIYLYHSHFGRLLLSSALFVIGAVLGTNGVLDLKFKYNILDFFSQDCIYFMNFWDLLFWLGASYLVGYAVVAITYAWVKMFKS